MSEQQFFLNELIPGIIFIAIGIVVGIITFCKLYRRWDKTLFHCVLALVVAALTAFGTFFMIAILFVSIRGRGCEGCQEYH